MRGSDKARQHAEGGSQHNAIAPNDSRRRARPADPLRDATRNHNNEPPAWDAGEGPLMPEQRNRKTSEWRFGADGAAAERREIQAATAAGRAEEYMNARDDARAAEWRFGAGQTSAELARERASAAADGLAARYAGAAAAAGKRARWDSLRAGERRRKLETRPGRGAATSQPAATWRRPPVTTTEIKNMPSTPPALDSDLSREEAAAKVVELRAKGVQLREQAGEATAVGDHLAATRLELASIEAVLHAELLFPVTEGRAPRATPAWFTKKKAEMDKLVSELGG